MLITREREKRIDAILYFSGNVEGLREEDLLELLLSFDAEHFRQTGQSAIGLVDADDERHSASEIVEMAFDAICSGMAFDGSHFSRRELRIMEDLVQKRAVVSEKKA